MSSCELGSLLQVAHRENMSAPTLTRKIKQLESEMGVTLLKRGPKGVQPTPEGLLLLEKSTTLLGLMDGLHDLWPAHNKKRSGVVTIIGSFSMTAGRLLDDIQTFLSLEENKDVQINLKEADKQTIVETVRTGHAAIGVFWDTIETGGLQTFPYISDTAACVVHQSHPLASRKQLSYKEVACYQTVRTKTTRLVEVMLERSGSIDAVTQNNRVEVPTFEALLRLVGTGCFAGICPKEVAKLYADFFELKIIPLSDRWANRRHVIGCINDAALTPAARGLLEHLCAQAKTNHLNSKAP